MVRYADNYLDLRNDPNRVPGYGLVRRTCQLIEHCPVQSHPGTMQVMDFGCADQSTVLEKPDRQKRDSAP